MAAKREERIRREHREAQGTSGERPRSGQGHSGQGRSGQGRSGQGRSGQDRSVSDSVPSGSILDRLGYVPSDAALPEMALRSDTWSTTLGESAEWLGDDGATEPPPQTLRDQLAQSGGFYSRVVPSVEEVTIPGPPRLPDLDPKDLSEGPPPGSDTPPIARRGGAAHVRAPLPEAVFIPPLLRRQAEDWQRTGSLTLPNTVSSRHARALQRALLLSMLQACEFSHLPEGIAQRAAWMFREGWGQGKKERDADDLCFVLGLTSGPASRSDVIAAATAHIPAESILPPSSARWSSRPPRPDR